MADFNRPGTGGSTEQHRRSGGAGGVAETVTEKAKEFTEGAQQMAAKAQESAQQMAHEAYERAGDALEDFNGMVRRNPLPSLLIAAGVGFLLGACLVSAGAFSARSYYR